MQDTLRPDQTGLGRFLRRALFWLRWAALAALLLLTLAQPTASRVGPPTWTLVLLFAGYNLLIDLLRPRTAWLRPAARVAYLDLALAALVYALGGEPGGPLVVLFFLAVDSAVAGLPLRGTLLYTAAAAARVEASALARLVAIDRDAARLPPSDRRARQAPNLAIDRDALVREALSGRRAPFAGLTPPAAIPLLDRSLHPLFAPYPHDPEQAAALWREAGGAGAQPIRVAAPEKLDLRAAGALRGQHVGRVHGAPHDVRTRPVTGGRRALVAPLTRRPPRSIRPRWHGDC